MIELSPILYFVLVFGAFSSLIFFIFSFLRLFWGQENESKLNIKRKLSGGFSLNDFSGKLISFLISTFYIILLFVFLFFSISANAQIPYNFLFLILVISYCFSFFFLAPIYRTERKSND